MNQLEQRCDGDLAFMLRYENVAWYEDGKVRILDRRSYPSKVEYVVCENYHEVTKAITDMVTQSAGPYTAAGMGMALAAFQCKDKTKTGQIEVLNQAAFELSHGRPTTVNRMVQVTDGCLLRGMEAISKGENVVDAIFERTIESLNRRYTTMNIVGEHLALKFPQNGRILTQCFGETIIGTMLRAARKNLNEIKLVCAETRPYLQGSRLTASCCQDMGFDTTVITDNMVAYAMQNEKIDLFTSAADTITRDGHVANKIGTFQIALLAKHFNIPYYATGIPDGDKFYGKDIFIEMRDAREVLEFRSIPITMEGVKGIYPAFDVTPPSLITGIVTDHGIFKPEYLEGYFDEYNSEFY